MYFPNLDYNRDLLDTSRLESVDVTPAVSLSDFRGLLVRVPRIRVLDNRAGVLGVDAAADVYPVFVCVTSAGAVMVDGLAPFSGIRDGTDLPLSPAAPVTICRSEDELPTFVDIHVLVVRSLQPARNVAAGINAAMTSTEGRTLAAAIQALATTANPVAGAVAGAAIGLLNLVTGAISNAKDPQIFYGRASLERQPEALGIGQTFTLGVAGQHRAVVDIAVVGVPKR